MDTIEYSSLSPHGLWQGCVLTLYIASQQENV